MLWPRLIQTGPFFIAFSWKPGKTFMRCTDSCRTDDTHGYYRCGEGCYENAQYLNVLRKVHQRIAETRSFIFLGVSVSPWFILHGSSSLHAPAVGRVHPASHRPTS
jgi:hypothetical protein